jgi:transcriptional repressor NrdR
VTADGMRRRRVCTVCKRRFTTYEKVGAPALKVQKRDGSLEPFEGDKLFHALQRVAAHRTVRDEDLRRIARDIEATLLDSGRKSVAWHDIVERVLERLNNIDAIAADRFKANYVDETGVLRFDDKAPASDARQLGLPLTDED